MLIESGPIPEGEYSAKILDVIRGPDVTVSNGRTSPTIEVEFELDIDRVDNIIVERILAFAKSYKLKKLFKAVTGDVLEQLDTDILLNKWVVVVISHNHKNDRTYANITDFKYMKESKASREAAELFEEGDNTEE